MARKKKPTVDKKVVDKTPAKVLDEKVLVEVPKVKDETLTEVPELIIAAPEVLNEVPPIDEANGETAELLTEVPPEPIGDALLEYTPPSPLANYVYESDSVSNHFSDEFAPPPQPRQPRGIPREKSGAAPIPLDSLSLKQRKALLGSFSKKSLAGRFGIKS